MQLLIPIYCPLPTDKGGTCNAYLNVDIEACQPLTVHLTCKNHPKGSGRFKITQDEHGTLTWNQVPADEPKQYMVGRLRIGTGGENG